MPNRRQFIAGATGLLLAGGPLNIAAQGRDYSMTSPRFPEDTAYWNDAYSNGAYIPNANQFYTSWVEDAEAFRQSAKGEFDIAYGSSPREKVDIFMPEGTPKGLAVFIHGGYWLETDKSMWSHLAAGAVANGWACALPSYDLAPSVRIQKITKQVATAIKKAADMVQGPIVITGHSAGGHLAMRMACEDAPLGDVTSRVKRVLGISGLYDLRPLMWTDMNNGLRLTMEEALKESPALLSPINGIETISWVGGDERPEFIRQSKLLANIWAGLGPAPQLVIDEGYHHFDVIAGLNEKSSAITKALLS